MNRPYRSSSGTFRTSPVSHVSETPQFHYLRLLSHTRKNAILRFLTNCICVERLLIKFEVASVYGHYYSDFYLTLLYWSTGRGMSFYAISTVSAHY